MTLSRTNKERSSQKVRTYYSVPSEAGIVDYNVDLAPSEFRGFLHKFVNILCV